MPKGVFWRKTQHNIPAAVSPSTVDLAWAAGFLEGEGGFCVNSRSLGRHSSLRVTATQKQREPLDKLQRLFGGYVGLQATVPYFRWTVNGVRARGVMYTVFTFLSRRRRDQIRGVLGFAGG
jgi:hypothetical protein